jgi:hypothetical protein
MVRAKFYVSTLTKQKMYNGQDGIGVVVKLNPVISGSDENKDFYKLSPSGSIELGTVNESAAAQFEIGKEYYVDFTPAPVS